MVQQEKFQTVIGIEEELYLISDTNFTKDSFIKFRDYIRNNISTLEIVSKGGSTIVIKNNILVKRWATTVAKNYKPVQLM